MSELVVGDIFCHEMKLKGREAFQVLKITDKNAVCISRSDPAIVPKQITKAFNGSVVLLRNINK